MKRIRFTEEQIIGADGKLLRVLFRVLGEQLQDVVVVDDGGGEEDKLEVELVDIVAGRLSFLSGLALLLFQALGGFKIDAAEGAEIVLGRACSICSRCCVGAAKEGANVAVADLNRAGAEETAAMVREVGRKATVIEMDTRKAVDAKRMAIETLKAFGRIDGIVCGALKLSPSKLEELTEEGWDTLMDVGLKGYFFCAQAAGRRMLEQGSGSIVLISSVAPKPIRWPVPTQSPRQAR